MIEKKRQEETNMATTNNPKVEFQICVANSAPELSAMVNEMLAKGWTCQGGIHTYQDLYPRFCQAMVKDCGQQTKTAVRTAASTSKPKPTGNGASSGDAV